MTGSIVNTKKFFSQSGIVKLVISVLICNCAGLLGSLFTIQSVRTWYALLIKPDFTPPGWLFAPVWFILYNLMGVAVFLIWRKGVSDHNVRQAINIFVIQLILNTLWSLAFFGFRSPLYGLIIIAPLWTAILLTIVYFYRVSRIASSLLLPYILWVSFATLLNFNIYLLNP